MRDANTPWLQRWFPRDIAKRRIGAVLAKAPQEGDRRALIAKERGATRTDLRGSFAEALGGVGSAYADANRRTPQGTRSFPEVRLRPLSTRA